MLNKSYVVFLALFLMVKLLVACKDVSSSYKNVVLEYYQGLQTGDFSRVASVVADSFTMVS